MKKIKAIVTPEEMKKIDRVLKEIYAIDDGSNHSVAFQLGFNTLSNLNGNGYNNLVLIADNLNYGGEEAAFSRYILGKVLPVNKIDALMQELLKNEANYKSILWPT